MESVADRLRRDIELRLLADIWCRDRAVGSGRSGNDSVFPGRSLSRSSAALASIGRTGFAVLLQNPHNGADMSVQFRGHLR